MAGKGALSGIKVVDFTWVVAGPIATKFLADHGATVIKVETPTRLDLTRAAPPFAANKPGVNRSAYFAQYNSSKLSVTLNLSTPKGLAVVRKLIAWSDLVVENFMPGTLEKWGLGYSELKELKRDIILLQASIQGKDGPEASMGSFGPQLLAAAGFAEVCGWPDRAPVSPGGVGYTDFFMPSFLVIAALAALDYRRRTGKGTCIDLAQFEASLSFLAPAILDCFANGRVATREGNRHPHAAPHGAYRCQGQDRWCTIAVFTDKEWEACCGVLCQPELARDARFATLLRRKANEADLDKIVEEWTSARPAEEVMALMQAAGVPAGVVEDGRDLFNDPQLGHREHFVFKEHPEMGVVSHGAAAFRLSKTPAEIRRAPCLGEHSYHVLTEIVGLSDEEFADLVEAGVVG